jgi:hypothetical protein
MYSVFNVSPFISGGVSAAILLLLLYMVVFSDNLKFVIENGVFTYYQNNKRKLHINLGDYYITYQAKTTDGDTDSIRLYLIHQITHAEEEIDCTAIGLWKFEEMYEEMKKYALKQAGHRLETIKKPNTA